MSGAPAQQHQISQTATTRIRNCSNSTNIDTIQCDSYAPKLRQRPPLSGIMGPQPKSVHTKPNRERSVSRSRCIPSVVTNAAPPGRSAAVTCNRVRRENSVNSVIRKEVYTSSDNPALVEVTVKTHGNGPQQGRTVKQQVKSTNGTSINGNRGEPWSKILQQNNMLTGIASEGSSFSNFDPLRTVHFLAQELQHKLQDNFSDDDHSIRQIISDMQQALNRVPPEVASTLGFSIASKPVQTPRLNVGFNYDYPTRDDVRQERLLGVIRGSSTVSSNTIERGCQTVKCRNLVLEPEKFQQHLEDSTAKIESACRQMEIVCSKLKVDKEELERELLTERELVVKMRAQLQETSTVQSATKERIEKIEIERNLLQHELQQLKLQLNGATSRSQLVQELQAQKSAADEQVASYRQQLTIAKMETEKYVAILAARDRQVTEIRLEMSQLQELVREQLREMQTAPFSSSATSCTTNATLSKQSLLPPWAPATHKLNNNEKKEFDRDIYKEIADAMANMAGGSSSCCRGGDTNTMTTTATTSNTSAGGSAASSTTTIAGVEGIMGGENRGNSATAAGGGCGTTVECTSDRREGSKSSLDVMNAMKAANDVILSNNNTTCPAQMLTANVSTQQQQQHGVGESSRSVSIRDMFADIKKQALLINAQQQQQHRSASST